jgi:hypothetical protein
MQASDIAGTKSHVPLSLRRSYQSISPGPRLWFRIFRNKVTFLPKLKVHPLSAVRDCSFNIFAATLHIGGRSVRWATGRKSLSAVSHAIGHIHAGFYGFAVLPKMHLWFRSFRPLLHASYTVLSIIIFKPVSQLWVSSRPRKSQFANCLRSPVFHETCQMSLYWSPCLNQELEGLTFSLCRSLNVSCEWEKNTVAAKMSC